MSSQKVGHLRRHTKVCEVGKLMERVAARFELGQPTKAAVLVPGGLSNELC